ncbi:ATPase, T2SS/T4P/T4SS family [Kitasatospora paracochleata]|uniref:Flp pilus assembly CpaF family ATPase n=1 Tax=Kitasatospora paracochleata TaxID=58354 RepID=A0ABT1J938_9ACTN|nr:ATPase, T2SS/T4P/T4SS family [Kitasatospora paracochleata]MCP2313957.1 Flp pilus assembly CpaF family ATPase [Kitasatospora paracochleata]
MDHALVHQIRRQSGSVLAQRRRSDEAAGLVPMDLDSERQYARSVIRDVLNEHFQAEAGRGMALPDAAEEAELAEAVHAALYGAGALQPLLEDRDIENIDMQGHDNVFITRAGGRIERGAPVCGSDDELVELVQTLAATAGLTSRAWDTVNWELDLRLPGGERLSAVMAASERPHLSIRKPRLGKVALDFLVKNGTVSDDAAQFLRSAVLAKKNMVICGATDSGKTTLLRAIANEIPPSERLITVEGVRELGLDEFKDLHPNIAVWEARLPNSEGQGEISLSSLVRRSLRQNPSRVIVGEVLGDEIIDMLRAMSQGNNGSLSTIHSDSAQGAFSRIALYALAAEKPLPIEASHMLIAQSINFVVFISKVRNHETGEEQRRVTEIREVNGFDGQVSSSRVFAYDHAIGALRADSQISCLPDLERHGYYPSGGWM